MVAPRFEIPPQIKPQFQPVIPPPRSRPPESLFRVFREMAWEGIEADVYLAFIGSGRLQLSGFLVTAKSKINDVIAHCPVELKPGQRKDSHRLIHRQLELARRIAENPQLADEMDDAISFLRLIRSGRPVPRWVYALACIPLSYPTNGEFLYSTPYCPCLLGALKAAG